MDYRRLGKSGLVVSLVGLGTNNFGGRSGKDEALRVINKGLDCGVTCIDTADIYPPGGEKGRSEEILGEALQGRRHDVVLATKFSGSMGEGPMQHGTSRRYVYNAVAASLKRLRTDYIDLYQIHNPDPQTPIEETLRALDDLVHAGMVRYLGCSNFKAWQIVEAQWTAKVEHLNPFISAQNSFSLIDRSVEAEVLPVCGGYGLGMLPYYPLASGFLTGKYEPGAAPPPDSRAGAAGPMGARMAQRTLTEGNFATLQRLRQFVEVRGHSVLDLAFAWLAAQPAVSSIIAGATKPEQVEANVAAASWRLSVEEAAEVSQIAAGA